MNPVHVEAARSIKNAAVNKAFVSQKLACTQSLCSAERKDHALADTGRQAAD